MALYKCLLFLIVVFSTIYSCTAQCSTSAKNFAACTELPVLNSTLSWNYYTSSNRVEIAFRKSGIDNYNSRWIAWAINPTSTGMIGSQSFVACPRSDGSLAAYTSPITSYETSLQEGNLSFPVYDVSATYENNSVTIFATLELPSNTTTVNHVWQEGPISGNLPSIHGLSGDNVMSFGTVDFLSGKIETIKGGKGMVLKNVHGVLCAVSWGIMMPIGVMIARYMKLLNGADPAWFYIHVTCQSLGYLVGIIGWGTGMYLGAQSSGIQYKGHRCIGITVFCLATTQVLVGMLLRPKKDHKYRIFWNIFHYCIGYGTIILSIWNVFKGIGILEPGKKWKEGYMSFIIALACLALIFEAIKWYSVLRRKKNESQKTLDDEATGEQAS
uniref:Cytochrome b561 and DOMON domain-containing protein n=2 Tax=Fagus sylvatica TaxID=28930 RepID=A0A2N9J5F5_FAGSY